MICTSASTQPAVAFSFDAKHPRAADHQVETTIKANDPYFENNNELEKPEKWTINR